MTVKDRATKLNKYITCLKCEMSGKCCDDNCPTQYEAGNFGEIVENLEEILKLLLKEPCEDLVSRKEVIRIAEQGQVQGYPWQFEKLVTLPSARVEDKNWIKLSEEKPKESGTYICTCKTDIRTVVTAVKYFYRTDRWELTGSRTYWKVIAWQPLPSPYMED